MLISVMKGYSYTLHSTLIRASTGIVLLLERMKRSTLNGLEETTVLLLLSQCYKEIHKLHIVKCTRVG